MKKALLVALFLLVVGNLFGLEWLYYNAGHDGWVYPLDTLNSGYGVEFIAPHNGWIDAARIHCYYNNDAIVSYRLYDCQNGMPNNIMVESYPVEIMPIDWTFAPFDTTQTYVNEGDTFFFFYVQVEWHGYWAGPCMSFGGRKLPAIYVADG